MDTERLHRFFAELRARVDMARRLDVELDKKQAHRFNVLDYLRTSEMGLSRILTDLLNPKASHGQQLMFLDEFLRMLEESSSRSGVTLKVAEGYRDPWKIVPDTVCVQREQSITDGRLDVSVEFSGDDNRKRRLVIENKVSPGDGRNQITRYLDFLGNQPENVDSDKWSLLYLSPTGDPPSEGSVDRARRAAAQESGQFAVMGYCLAGPSESPTSIRPDEDGGNRVSADHTNQPLEHSLADWFRACRKACDVDRLRWFLRDAQSYCEQRFGGTTMTESKKEQVYNFLLMDRANAGLAPLVAECVPKLKNRVRDIVFRHVRTALEDFGRRSSSWALKEIQDKGCRLLLYRQNQDQWFARHYHGVWFKWGNDVGWLRGVDIGSVVGVEWPAAANAFLTKADLDCFFPDGSKSTEVHHHADKEKKQWFARRPVGEDSLGWEELLAKTDAELEQYAHDVVRLMERLAEAIDAAEDAHIEAADVG